MQQKCSARASRQLTTGWSATALPSARATIYLNLIALAGQKPLCRGLDPTCCTPQALPAPSAGEWALYPLSGSLDLRPGPGEGPSSGLLVPLLQWSSWLLLLSMLGKMPCFADWRVSLRKAREGAMRGWEQDGASSGTAAAAAVQAALLSLMR